MTVTPEQHARQTIDHLLEAAGWWAYCASYKKRQDAQNKQGIMTR